MCPVWFCFVPRKHPSLRCFAWRRRPFRGFCIERGRQDTDGQRYRRDRQTEIIGEQSWCVSCTSCILPLHWGTVCPPRFHTAACGRDIMAFFFVVFLQILEPCYATPFPLTASSKGDSWFDPHRTWTRVPCSAYTNAWVDLRCEGGWEGYCTCDYTRYGTTQ